MRKCAESLSNESDTEEDHAKCPKCGLCFEDDDGLDYGYVVILATSNVLVLNQKSISHSFIILNGVNNVLSHNTLPVSLCNTWYGFKCAGIKPKSISHSFIGVRLSHNTLPVSLIRTIGSLMVVLLML